MVVDSTIDYAIDGSVLRDLLKIASRLNDGMKLGPDERRNLAQAMQAKLEHAQPLTHKVSRASQSPIST